MNTDTVTIIILDLALDPCDDLTPETPEQFDAYDAAIDAMLAGECSIDQFLSEMAGIDEPEPAWF